MGAAGNIGRLVISPPSRGSWNMALDQALLKRVQDDGIPILRFYQWSVPTLSLGYFQNYSHRSQHPASRELDVVRRSTGGGAIVHDRELTYSLCLPSQNRMSGAAIEIYQAVHKAIIKAGKTLGFSLSRHAEKSSKVDRKSTSSQTINLEKTEPFLCFQRRTDEDLILSGYKIVGSAQRRSAGALLQHGSILLASSDSAPELPGINDLSANAISPEELRCQMLDTLSESLQLEWVEAPIAAETMRIAEEIEARFLSADWTEKRP